MIEVRKLETFSAWLEALRDRKGALIIARRVDRIALGNFGDNHSVGDGVWELRIDFGPGYRVYFKRRGQVVVILLCGGDKDSQERDIRLAKQLAQEMD